MLVLDVDFISPSPVYHPDGLPLVGVVLSVGLGFAMLTLRIRFLFALQSGVHVVKTYFIGVSLNFSLTS